MCGSQVSDQSRVNGHNGYDWRMPEGTPLLAVADGLVMHAGLEEPFNCPPLGRTVQAIYVQLRHRGADGLEYISIYGHLSRVGVAEGDLVTSGTTVGWSGNTGCSGTPHLHFGTFKGRDGNFRADRSVRLARLDTGPMGGGSAWRGERVALEGWRGAAHTII